MMSEYKGLPKNMRSLLALLAIFVTSNVIAKDGYDFHKMNGGWTAFTQQTDPFDKSKVSILQIIKDGFVIRCGSLNLRLENSSYDSFSFPSKMKYVVDDNQPVDKKGTYSTYLDGSDMVNNSRYFSYKMSKQDVELMMKGNLIKVAGSFGSSGWTTKEVDLVGFSSAYEQMCGK